MEDGIGFPAFCIRPEGSRPSLVEEFRQNRFVSFPNLFRFCLPAFFVMVEQGGGSHVFGVGFQLHLYVGVSLERLEGRCTDTVIIGGTCLQGHECDVGGIRQFVGRAEGLPVEGLPVRVVHTLSGILQHVSIPHEGVFNPVVQIPTVGLHTDGLELCQRFFQSAGIQQADNIFDSFVHGLLVLICKCNDFPKYLD